MTISLSLMLNLTTAQAREELKQAQDGTTAAAIEEGRKLMTDPTAPRYSSMADLKAALGV